MVGVADRVRRDRSGAPLTLQVLVALGPGHPSDRCPLNPWQGRGQARLHAYMCRAPCRSAVALRSQTGWTANLQGFRIRAPEGWPLLQRCARPSTGHTVPRSCGQPRCLGRVGRLMSTVVTFSALAASWSAVTAIYPVSASQTAWVTAVTDGILPAC